MNVWREIYEKEFQRLLHMPQLGLTRFYQERANTTLDNFTMFQAAIAEFLHMLYLLMEKFIKIAYARTRKDARIGNQPPKTSDIEA